MDYVICALGMPFNGTTVSEESLGGSESAAYYMARELARRGHRVTVFTTHEQGGMSEGVNYVPCGPLTPQTPLGAHFEFYARNTPHDVLIIQRHPTAFDRPFASKVNIWQTHDLALHRTGGPINAMMWNVDAVTCVSNWHKAQLREVYGLSDEIVSVVRNGVDPALYAEPISRDVPLILPGDGDELRLLYQSRPERGLEHLVRPGGIMDRLRGVARLYVCGYDNTTQEMAPYYEQLNQWAAALPNVTRLGALDKRALADTQRQMHVLCYPTEFEEVSCVTAMEAMHAGLPMVTSAAAALTETCAGAGVELIPLKDGAADEDAFVEWVSQVALDRMNARADSSAAARVVGGASVFVAGEPTVLDRMGEAQRESAKLFTWVHAVDDLEALVSECFEQSRSFPSLLKHALKVGDLPLFDYVTGNIVPAEGALVQRAVKERRDMYAFLASDEAYAAHYAKHGGAYYRDTPREERWRVPEETTRYKATGMQLAKVRQVLNRPLRVLDYGCAHGHYSIGLARALPDCEFVGVDLVPQAVEEAREWSASLGLTNTSFCAPEAVEGEFDVVLLAEVLEHVRDYPALLREAQARLRPDGAIITTTPYGPWEWIGHEPYKTGREHWQHFERADLLELFCVMSPDIVCAPAGAAPGNTPIGSWVALAWPQGRAFGSVNMARKLAATRPEQTISACMIVKDGEHVLGKALESLVPWVAEIVIGIDASTSDRTLDVITEFERRNPWTAVDVFHNVSALKSGFDEARNATVGRATGDWILWMDADEELIGGAELPKLQRPNMHQAYCVPQMHFSINPPQVLTVDLPSRLFRNNGKCRFYGRVHEHPEVSPGEAIPTATARGEMAFAHNGYITEEKRRERYFRNLPLLLRDIEDHPDRLLNKFLLIRDLAQGVGFELQSNGGRPMPDHRARCQRVVDLWRELLACDKPVSRMLLDALQYYTMAAEVLGGWFEANVGLHVSKSPADTKLNVQAKFVSIDDFSQLLQRLSKEATVNYDSRYF